MSDRYFALTVALDKDMKDEDAEAIIEAIRMIRGVLSVEPHVADIVNWTATERARSHLIGRILEVLKRDPS